MMQRERNGKNGRFIKWSGPGTPGHKAQTPEARAERRELKREREKVRLAIALAAKESANVMNAAVIAAKAGDVAAMSLVLSRTVPPTKESPAVKVPGLSGDPRAAMHAVLQRVEEGELSAERAELLLALVEKRAGLELSLENLVRFEKFMAAVRADPQALAHPAARHLIDFKGAPG